ncbi:MAG: sensor histidine kinase [Propionibacteriaceae bacterium]
MFREHPTATRTDWVVDGCLAALLTSLTCAPHALIMLLEEPYSAYYGNPVLVLLTCLGMTIPLILRRHYPLLMLSAIALSAMAQVCVTQTPTLSLIVIPLAVYSVARWVDGEPARIALWWGVVGATLGPLRWVLAVGPFYAGRMILLIFTAVVCFGCVVTPYAVGRRIREQSEADIAWRRTQLERQRITLLTQEQRVRVAEANARQEIARELHDIVAHSLSVMIVQAEGGKAIAIKKPEAAAAVLGTIAETGREALDEARRIVGVLRSNNQNMGSADFGPAPTLADIPDLVARTGDRIHLAISGTQPILPSTLELTAYRVIQEALTNFLKHAGPRAHAWVNVTYQQQLIDIYIRDDGAGAAIRSDGLGNGLRGMEERVTAMGGTLAANPLSEGGFAVHVLLPVTGKR